MSATNDAHPEALGYTYRCWQSGEPEPTSSSPLPGEVLVLSRALLGPRDARLSREGNAPSVRRGSGGLRVWANPEAKLLPLIVKEWTFDAFQEGMDRERQRWPLRPAELSKPRRLVVSEREGVGLFARPEAMVNAGPLPHYSLPHYLLCLPGCVQLRRGEVRTEEPPFTVVLGDAAVEFTGTRTLAPEGEPVFRDGVIPFDAAGLRRRAEVPGGLSGRSWRHVLHEAGHRVRTRRAEACDCFSARARRCCGAGARSAA